LFEEGVFNFSKERLKTPYFLEPSPTVKMK